MTLPGSCAAPSPVADNKERDGTAQGISCRRPPRWRGGGAQQWRLYRVSGQRRAMATPGWVIHAAGEGEGVCSFVVSAMEGKSHASSTRLGLQGGREERLSLRLGGSRVPGLVIWALSSESAIILVSMARPLVGTGSGR